MIRLIKLFLRDIRIEHTLFALPFGYVGAVFGAGGHPTFRQLLWVTLAVLGARTAAMAANRVLDRKIDARNPRTAKRATATGALPLRVMLGAIIAGLLLTLLAAWQLNPLCVWLLPVAAIGIVGYPLCKRFTWTTHFVLGAVDGFAPLGAAIGVSGHITFVALLLFAAVTVWVAGFDILYALMDFDIDRDQGIHSIPAIFGRDIVLWLPVTLHAIMACLLIAVGAVACVGPLYAIGVFAALLLIAYEFYLIRSQQNPFTLNDRIFNANMLFSLIFLISSAASFMPVRL